jgi:hypothetical protein
VPSIPLVALLLKHGSIREMRAALSVTTDVEMLRRAAGD